MGGVASMPYVYIPELGRAYEPGLRILLRVGPRQTLVEYLRGWSNRSEVSYLVAHRAAGRVIVELPQLAVDARGAVDFGMIPDATASVDFDRYSREFLSLARTYERATPAPSRNLRLADDDPDVLATALDPSLIILRKARGATGEVQVLRLFRDGHLGELDWSAVMLSGDWIKSGTHDTPEGVQITRNNGRMCFHRRGRTGVEVLFAPYCATCEIVDRGRVHVVDLKQETVGSQVIWLDDLGTDRQWLAAGRERASPPAAPPALLKLQHAGLSAKNNIALTVVSPADSTGIAAMLRFCPGCCLLMPEELGLHATSGPTVGIAHALRVIGHSGSRNIALDITVPGAPELAERLLRADHEAKVIVLLGIAQDEPKGLAAAYCRLGPWFRLADRFRGRLVAASTSRALTSLFSRQGIPAVAIGIPLPALGPIECFDLEQIEIVILPGSPIVPSAAHMITAVAHARKTGLRIGRLWLPAQDGQGDRIARSFAAAPELEHYDNLEAAFCGNSHRRVALGVFPDDDELPEGARLALARGALPILGPASTFSRYAAFRNTLVVVYWEDALAIADALAGTVKHFDRLVEDYNRFRADEERATDAAVAALIKGRFDISGSDLAPGC